MAGSKVSYPPGGTGSGTPAAPDTSVQFNDGGAFGGNVGFTFNKTTGELVVNADIINGVTPSTAINGFVTGGSSGNTRCIRSHATGSGANLRGILSTVGTLGASGHVAGFEDIITIANTTTEVFIASHTLNLSADTPTIWGHNQNLNISANSSIAIIGNITTLNLSSAANTPEYIANNIGVNLTGTSNIDNLFGDYRQYVKGTTATVGVMYSYWVNDITGIAPNNYYLWLDSQGVYRIREDSTFDSIGQAITALYNPLFTKYTPGTTNFERIVQYWSANVANYGTEAGGTGTQRALRLLGSSVDVQDGASNYVAFKALTLQPTSDYLSVDGTTGTTGTDVINNVIKNGLVTEIGSIPLYDPGINGQLYNDNGFVKVSGVSGVNISWDESAWNGSFNWGKSPWETIEVPAWQTSNCSDNNVWGS